ncbi:MAG: hypothetical protein CMJ40_01730 [Phycisphaerae bacterium]|nr:hypothetical protein [Phycisphaerae bacterium]
MNSSQDQIARRAAELLRDGLVGSIGDAIRQARKEPDGANGDPPSFQQVRRHVDAMEMARLGMEGWEANRLTRLEEVDQFLATLEFHLDGIEMRIAGRAARGEIDEGDRVHVRAWIDDELDSAVRILETVDVGPIEVGSRVVDPTVASGLRRLSTILIRGERIEFLISLCPVRAIVTTARNLVTGSDIQLACPRQVRDMLGG